MLENRSVRVAVMRVGVCCAVLAAGVLTLGTLRIGQAAPGRAAALEFGPTEAFAVQAADGQRTYNTLCAACHQADGSGVAGMFPPVAGSEWVTGDEGRLIRIILHGLTGPIQVGDKTYSGTMPPFGGALNNAEVAAVATYIRSNFGNSAPAISAAAVGRIRNATGARRTPWTQQELEAEMARQ